MTHALVVDDNVDLATNVAELLETLELHVHLAHDVETAVEIAMSQEIDLAVVDLRLPRGESGVDLVPKLRASCPDVEIVIVTGNATVDSAVFAVRQGVFAYVQKPFDSNDFLAIARRALAQVHGRRERQRLTVELARSEAMYRSLVDTVDAAIVVLDLDGRVQFANRFAGERCEMRPGDSLDGRSFVDVFIEPTGANRVRRAIEMIRKGVEPEPIEATTPSPPIRAMRWSFLEKASEKARGVLAVGVDLTDLRELQRRTAEAEALGAVGTLTTGLAHEIRNPLNAASLQLELLVRSTKRVEDSALRTSMEDRVRIVRAELGRLGQMLSEFLSLARPRSLEMTTTDLAAIVDEVVELQRPLAEAQGASLTHAIPKGTFAVCVDSARIKQVLINLVGNSLEALRSTETGHVTIDARLTDAERVEVRISDDGPGVTLNAGEAFRPFVTTKEGGTGLGLSIVRKIVEQHGGVVTLTSREPRGTIASFSVATVT